MINNKTVLIIIMIVLLVSLILPACAPAKPAATPPAAPAATTPAAPATTPAAPAATIPAAPASGTTASKALSFTPETYTNDELGFTWQYPKTWIKGELSGNYVFIRLSDSSENADTAGIIVVPETSDFAKTLTTEFEADPGLYGSKVTVGPVKTTKLADGKTTASEAIVTATVMGFDLYAYTVGINKGGKTIIAFGATLGGGAKQALMEEMSKTLAVK
jgi:hypothetical protein